MAHKTLDVRTKPHKNIKRITLKKQTVTSCIINSVTMYVKHLEKWLAPSTHSCVYFIIIINKLKSKYSVFWENKK